MICVFDSPKKGDDCVFDAFIDPTCVFDNPDLNGNCIFDRELLEVKKNKKGQGWDWVKPDVFKRNETEEELILMMALPPSLF